MHVQTLENWQHGHDFAVIHDKGERRTTQVLILTAVTMVVEIIAGAVFGSMALLADGWHMATHVAAFMITIFAYKYAKKNINNPLFTFGTGKVTVLGGFASAIALVVVALVMALESIQRIFNPHEIYFNEAIAVATLGLLVNIICAFILQGHYVYTHEHKHYHHDHNLKAAFFHVLADALTSVLAIVALLGGKIFGWNWMDPIMGIISALVITRWSYSLLKETSPILLDGSVEEDLKSAIRAKIESQSDNRISDLHLWKVGPGDYAVIISLVTHFPKQPDYYKCLLKDFHELSHITIEVHKCTGEPCVVPESNTA